MEMIIGWAIIILFVIAPLVLSMIDLPESKRQRERRLQRYKDNYKPK